MNPWILKACASAGWLALALPAAADNPPVADSTESLGGARYVVGGVMGNGPIYFGQSERASGFRPLFALRLGWLRLSNSGAGGLIGEGHAGGASAEVYNHEGLRLRLGLRLDRGRRIEDDSSNRLEDLPRVRGTVRGRLGLSYRLDPQTALNLTAAPDLLGRGGGTLVSGSVARNLPTPDWLSGLGGQWTLSGGLVGGDDRYMNSYFGIAPGGRRFAAYEAEGGLRNAALGLGWQRGFGERQQWVLFSGVNAQRLLGSAADAPFVQRKLTWSADIGLAYRH